MHRSFTINAQFLIKNTTETYLYSYILVIIAGIFVSFVLFSPASFLFGPVRFLFIDHSLAPLYITIPYYFVRRWEKSHNILQWRHFARQWRINGRDGETASALKGLCLCQIQPWWKLPEISTAPSSYIYNFNVRIMRREWESINSRESVWTRSNFTAN